MEAETNSKSLTFKVFPKVAIIILNWNGWKDTIECLESVFRIDYPNYQVIVVDNGSKNDSVERIKAWAEGRQEVLTPEPTHPLYPLSHPPVQKPIPYIEYDRNTAEAGGLPEKEKLLYEKLPKGISYPLILIQTGENLGFAGGNNVGIKYALAKDDFEYVWLLNNDAVVDKEALTEMVKLAESDEEISVVGSKLLYYYKPDTIQALGGKINKWLGTLKQIANLEKDNGQWNKEFEVEQVAGTSMLIKESVIKEAGLMDENYFLYWEDVNWCLRIKRLGWKLFYCPKSKVWHKEGGTVGYKSPVSDYYSTRNNLILWKKFFRSYLPIVFIILFVGKIINRIKRKQFKNISYVLKGYKDFLEGKSGKYIEKENVNAFFKT
jgi:GT2 family glycosyltransferase